MYLLWSDTMYHIKPPLKKTTQKNTSLASMLHPIANFPHVDFTKCGRQTCHQLSIHSKNIFFNWMQRESFRWARVTPSPRGERCISIADVRETSLWNSCFLTGDERCRRAFLRRWGGWNFGSLWPHPHQTPLGRVGEMALAPRRLQCLCVCLWVCARVNVILQSRNLHMCVVYLWRVDWPGFCSQWKLKDEI